METLHLADLCCCFVIHSKWQVFLIKGDGKLTKRLHIQSCLHSSKKKFRTMSTLAEHFPTFVQAVLVLGMLQYGRLLSQAQSATVSARFVGWSSFCYRPLNCNIGTFISHLPDIERERSLCFVSLVAERFLVVPESTLKI